MKEEKIISDGKHMLSGCSEHSFNVGWSGEDTVTGIIFTLDGKNYACYADPDDGYRSYGCLFETNDTPTNTFPPQEVFATTETEDSVDDNGWPRAYSILYLCNSAGEVILKLGTDYSDSYYPYGIFGWNPENLDINKSRNLSVYEILEKKLQELGVSYQREVMDRDYCKYNLGLDDFLKAIPKVTDVFKDYQFDDDEAVYIAFGYNNGTKDKCYSIFVEKYENTKEEW